MYSISMFFFMVITFFFMSFYLDNCDTWISTRNFYFRFFIAMFIPMVMIITLFIVLKFFAIFAKKVN